MSPTDPPPAAASDDVIDRLVLGSADTDWLKVAVLIAKVVDAAAAEGIVATGQPVAQRIYVLAEQGRLEVRGNVRRWRAGEVRQRPSEAGH